MEPEATAEAREMILSRDADEINLPADSLASRRALSMVLASAHTFLDTCTGRSFRLLVLVRPVGAFGAADEAAAEAVELALDEADFRDDDDDDGLALLLDLPLEVLDDADDDAAAVSLPAVEMNPSSPPASNRFRDDKEEEEEAIDAVPRPPPARRRRREGVASTGAMATRCNGKMVKPVSGLAGALVASGDAYVPKVLVRSLLKAGARWLTF